MNKEYRNLNDLYADLESEMVKGLRKIATEIKGVLKHYIQTEIYDKGESTDWYNRTYELLECLETSEVKKVGKGEYQVYVYFDTSKMHPFQRRGIMNDYDGFNAHMSLNGDKEYGGRTISDWLVQWWEYGNDNPIWDMEARHPIQKTREWVKDDRYHINRMCEILRDKKLNVIVN